MNIYTGHKSSDRTRHAVADAQKVYNYRIAKYQGGSRARDRKILTDMK